MRVLFSAIPAVALLIVGCASSPIDADFDARMASILASPHRSAEHRARDAHRRPAETLSFFGIRRDMTVVEVWPGTGWYTEILAPFLDQGTLYAAQLDPSGGDYARQTAEGYRDKLAAQPDLYRRVIVTTLASAPAKGEIAPKGSADMVLTFRNIHNWMMFGWEREALEAMYVALKPGGILGVVEHRGDPNVPQDAKAATGYVAERYAIDLIESVGFKLVSRSEINANPRDTKDYPKGVWTLPPNYALGVDSRAKYDRIGESDRFTLKFVKPAERAQ